MRVGRTFSMTLDPSSQEPLFGDQPLGLLPEEVWHPSAKSLLQAKPAAPGNTSAAVASPGADAVAEEDWDSDDSLQPYDMPEQEDKSEPASPASHRCCACAAHVCLDPTFCCLQSPTGPQFAFRTDTVSLSAITIISGHGLEALKLKIGRKLIVGRSGG